MKGFTEDISGKKLPYVTVFDRPKGWIFRIITTDTIIDLEEKEAKRLYRQLHTAFRPNKTERKRKKSPVK